MRIAHFAVVDDKYGSLLGNPTNLKRDLLKGYRPQLKKMRKIILAIAFLKQHRIPSNR